MNKNKLDVKFSVRGETTQVDSVRILVGEEDVLKITRSPDGLYVSFSAHRQPLLIQPESAHSFTMMLDFKDSEV